MARDQDPRGVVEHQVMVAVLFQFDVPHVHRHPHPDRTHVRGPRRTARQKGPPASLTSAPPRWRTSRLSKAWWITNAARNASPAFSQPAVEPSMSVCRNVTVPTGGDAGRGAADVLRVSGVAPG